MASPLKPARPGADTQSMRSRWRLGALAALGATVIATAPHSAVGSSPPPHLSEVIVASPGPGYEVVDEGGHTRAELEATDGFKRAWSRSWLTDGSTPQSVEILVVEWTTKVTSRDIRNFHREAKSDLGGEEYAVGVGGVAGFTHRFEEDGVAYVERYLTFAKGALSFNLAVAAPDPGPDAAAVADLVRAQIAFAPSVGGGGGSGGSFSPIGIPLLIAPIAAIVGGISAAVRHRRRRAVRGVVGAGWAPPGG
ncbi:MAG: hypothetical protein ACRD0F_08525, partial [Acidimicrobiales bacterium]